MRTTPTATPTPTTPAPDAAAKPGSEADLGSLLTDVTVLRDDLVRFAAEREPSLARVHPAFRESAHNLLHYLGLRRHDLRPLQGRLARRGLSSLGRAEPHVLANVDAVLDVLRRLLGGAPPPGSGDALTSDFERGERLLDEHADALLGPHHAGRAARIMVTMPAEAADDPDLILDLVKRGMDCMRVNCAHDDAAAWSRMIENLRRAERATGRTCRVLMDLAGPKLRTGPLEPGPAVVKIRPRRDPLGQVLRPAHVWLTSAESPRPAPAAADAVLPMPGAWLARLVTGDRIDFDDARGSPRTFSVVDASPEGCWADLSNTAYLVPGTRLRRRDDDDARGRASVGGLPALASSIRLRPGDLLVLSRGTEPGRPATTDALGEVLHPAVIGCTLPQVFDDVRGGDRICFDDGKIAGVVVRAGADRLEVRITRTPGRGANLAADKGINLPDSALRLSAMTEKDAADLAFVARHADLVALSFANGVADVERLQESLARIEGRRPAVVLKIETKRGFEHLPEMLLAAMRGPTCGVMIARGDLAVECGFERLAEVQEEILWLCEAAHVPVIWATQVLENLARDGLPSRAEITDAAMSHRAECVMLNKGPHVVEAVRALDDILRRMQGHQSKKRSMLRELHLASAFTTP